MFTKFNYGWELWIGNLKIAWVKSVKWSFDCTENLVYIQVGHLEINNSAL